MAIFPIRLSRYLALKRENTRDARRPRTLLSLKTPRYSRKSNINFAKNYDLKKQYLAYDYEFFFVTTSISGLNLAPFSFQELSGFRSVSSQERARKETIKTRRKLEGSRSH